MPMPHEQAVVIRWFRWLIGTAVVLLLIWGGYWGVAIYALNRAVTECGSEVLHEAASADSQYIATAFERSCGATAPFLRVVSVRPRGTHFDGDNRDAWAFAVEGQPDMLVTWTGPRQLTVKCGSGGGRVARQAVIWSGVAISYQ
jgi:hypothetical protein